MTKELGQSDPKGDAMRDPAAGVMTGRAKVVYRKWFQTSKINAIKRNMQG